ncbi:hypothetical protein [Streptomyces sp. HUAS TT20]|uniref:hypothetical protein n=1 Tax=Streptomyces sp. HUAS TT20 TaxID=3447509 RepID=UPI0021DB03A2|nr:hypothetical protein [Streptomyces sp. HUAS 15-9]UXY31135.1 hypothetical protein N8I87_34350 [Streptomyces sp. HUAS 15-9]
MEPTVSDVESSLVVLVGVSLDTLRSIDARVLAGSVQELLPQIDHQLASVSQLDGGAMRFD